MQTVEESVAVVDRSTAIILAAITRILWLHGEFHGPTLPSDRFGNAWCADEPEEPQTTGSDDAIGVAR